MFKDIKGFEGRYLVNAQGEIYSCPKKQKKAVNLSSLFLFPLIKIYLLILNQ